AASSRPRRHSAVGDRAGKISRHYSRHSAPSLGSAGFGSTRAKSSIVPSSAGAGGHPHRKRLGEADRPGASRHQNPYTGGDDHGTWTSTHLLPATGPGGPEPHDLRARRPRGLGTDRRLSQ